MHIILGEKGYITIETVLVLQIILIVILLSLIAVIQFYKEGSADIHERYFLSKENPRKPAKVIINSEIIFEIIDEFKDFINLNDLFQEEGDTQ